MTRTIGSLGSLTFGLFAALTFAGCSGGSSGGGSTPVPVETGEVTVAVTDAATDEIDTFEVDIIAFRFEKANGAKVEVLPQTTRVDFAKLVSVSEVIAGATLPVGVYTKAFITLDFGGAAVRISGSTTSANLVDGNGNPLSGREELEIVFSNGGFAVGARKGYFAEVDFDLDQSLTVDAAANKVTVDTVLYASINPAQPKDARVPGLARNYTGASFDLDVRLGLGLISRGVLTVNTTGSTVYDLGGTVHTGQAGYDALEALGDNTIIVALGQVDPRTRTLACRRVVLLPQNLDEVGGLVVARNTGPGTDTTLVLRGVAVRRQLGAVTFNDTVTIRTSLVETKVNKRGVAAGTLDVDAINVGQRILAYGTFNGSELDLTQPGAGFVRLVETDLRGEAAGVPSGGQLDVKAHRIGVRTITAFDPLVAGVPQWDGNAISCGTGGLGLSSITSGSPIVVRGFFAPVTSTTSTAPAFQADTVIDRTNAASLMRIWWLPASTAPIATSSAANEIELDISGTLVKNVDRGLVAPTTLSSNPTVNGGSGLYAVRVGLTLTLLNDFAAFKSFIQSKLAAGHRMAAFRAVGKYDLGANTLTAARAFATLF